MAQEDHRLCCPGCGQTFTPAAKYRLPDGSWRCPSCQKEFLPRKAAPKADAPPPAEAEVLLPLCPICEEGAVVAAGSSGEEELFACRSCQSVLSETIFGLRYKRLDPRFEKRKEEFKGQTFTRVQLKQMSEQLLRAKKAKEQKLARAAQTAPEPEADAEELWWELDREELARRRKAAPKQVRKNITVDDLLDELKRKPGA